MLTGPVWLSLLAQTSTALPPTGSCVALSSVGVVLERTVAVRGLTEVRVELPKTAVPMLVKVAEDGIDVAFEVRDGKQVVIARADSPAIRTGTQLAFIQAGAATPRAVVIRSKEHEAHNGSVTVIVRTDGSGDLCGPLERRLATADMRYAAAHAAARSNAQEGDTPAVAIFKDAAQKYEALLADVTQSPAQRGAIELALASIFYYDLSEWSKSADWSTAAAASFAKAKDPYAGARARAILAAAWMEMGTTSSSGGSTAAVPFDARTRFDAARKLLKELELFHQSRGEAYDAALQTNNIGLAFYYEARFAEAIPAYSAAMKVFEVHRETPRVALALQNIALCDWGLGRLTAALPRFDRALDLMDPHAHPDLYLLTVNSSALAHYAAGKYDESLRLHARGLEYATKVQNDYYRGRSLMGLGITYYAIGDRQLASQFLRSALDILTPGIDGRGRTTALRSLAVIEHDERRFAEAARHNREALEFAVATSARARIKVRLGANFAAMGDIQRAKAELEPVIEDPPGGDALVRAEGRMELGRLLRVTGDHAGARTELTAALQGFLAMQSLAGEFDCRLELARLESGLKRNAEAITALEKALRLADEIATQTGNPEYRASVVQSLRPAQDLMLDLQYARYAIASAEGRRDEAERVARFALDFADGNRAQSFGQILSQRFSSEDPILAKLLAERENLHRNLADLRFYLSTREDRRGPDDDLAKSLRKEIAALRAQLGVKNTELARRVRGRKSTGDLPLIALDFTRTESNRMFVEYWLGALNAYAWTASNSGVRWIKLASGPSITEAARELHAAMRRLAVARTDNAAHRARRQQAVVRMHGLVIAPLGPMTGVDELVVAADGPLHVIPFAALRGANAGDRYLVAHQSIAFVPALRFAGLSASSREAPGSAGRMLLVDDPVYQAGDARLASSRPPLIAPEKPLSTLLTQAAGDPRQLQRLPSTAREAAAIRRRFGDPRVELLEGLDATRQALLSRDLSSYRYIHIASHGEMDTEIPQLSALILGKYGRKGPLDDQKVWVDDLLSRTFNADVVVLSACDTSLGPEFAGEGPLGLRYAVLARGARSVVSSLWPVADEITADLMTEMYGELTNKANRADKALTLAMRRLLNARPTLDPALWAPYTVHLAIQEERKK